MKALSTLKVHSKALNEVMLVVGGVVLLFAASQIEIPIKPISITLQTVAVMLIGLTYTPRRALETHLIWIGLGGIGLPMFYGFSGGMGVLIGPTAGYIAGFVISTTLMATLKEKFLLKGWFYDMSLCIMGTVIIFSTGVLWLSLSVGIANAFMFGVFPFILPGIIKAGFLCTVLRVVQHYKNR